MRNINEIVASSVGQNIEGGEGEKGRGAVRRKKKKEGG